MNKFEEIVSTAQLPVRIVGTDVAVSELAARRLPSVTLETHGARIGANAEPEPHPYRVMLPARRRIYA